MLASIQPRRSRLLWRAIYIISTVLVISYIFFEVLDLDGSNLPWLRHPVKGHILVVNDLKEVERALFPARLEGWEHIPYLPPSYQGELGSFQGAGNVRMSPLAGC